MKVLVFSGLFEPGFRGGGPVRSVVRIIDTAPAQAEISVVTRDRDHGSKSPYVDVESGTWVERGASRIFYLDVRALRQWLRLLRGLWSLRFADLVYLNSVWSRHFSILPVMLMRTGLLKPRSILIAPRGEFSHGALNLKARRKRIFFGVWRRILRGLPVTWHASTEREAADIRAAVPGSRIEIVADQVSLPSTAVTVSSSHDGVLRLVFISRISPMKNLESVLLALRAVEAPVTLDIYGPIEDVQYWATCEALLRGLPAHVGVRHCGHLLPAQVRSTFAQYDAFVFPTRGENFGHVIPESLSASCPVICSDATPWSPVLRAGGGVALDDPTPSALATEIRHLASLSTQEKLDLKLRAGAAYERWRSSIDDVNVLKQVLERLEVA
jgi:glycosyltransferase involved in cell wall biosynthesis